MDELKDNRAVLMLDQEKGVLPLTSLVQEALMIAASFAKNPRPILVIKQNLYNAQRLYEKIIPLLGESGCALFGADESLRVEAIASSPEMTAQKVETLASLLDDSCRVVITCVPAFVRQLPLPEHFRSGCIHLKTGDIADMNELKNRLLAGGYIRTSHIDQPLSFAQRGGIIDVYSINYDEPLRIEFFDTEIDSIRFFDVTTQKTVRTADEVFIVPASDVLFTAEEVNEIRTKADAGKVSFIRCRN